MSTVFEQVGIRDDLRAITADLAELDARRAEIIATRDGLIAKARSESVSWLAIQEDTGLTPRGVKLALDRASAGRAKN